MKSVEVASRLKRLSLGASLFPGAYGVHPVWAGRGYGLGGPQRRRYRPPDAWRHQPGERGSGHYPRRLRPPARPERHPRQRQPRQRDPRGRPLV